ncbi:LLM class flavin-dependent oxidoreductase [Rhodococcus olei]|uniref:LLM class flavin-dependent oxidoreductase n=1 Tax=Rhodococcus olei TaxID=2161675 RepID=A0ABP8PTC4_9NOCA
MKIDLFTMPTIPSTMDEREELRPIGRNAERYQMMLDELRQIAVMADEAGIDAFSTTEHHFHTEGGEMMPNPPLLYADLAARTKNIAFMPFSMVITADHPIRVAEDIALLDHLTKGRVKVAFARGYQKRWIQTLSPGTAVAHLDDDQANRERFDEALDIILNAWTKDAFDYDGKHFQVPFPHTGIEGWAGPEWTRRYGAPGEIDDHDVIRKIGVVPRPFQSPYPEVCLPVTGSPATLLNAARKGFTAFMLAPDPKKFTEQAKTYQAEAAKHGHDLPIGKRIGAVRSIVVGDTYEEAFDIACQTTGYEYHHYFHAFGFAEMFRSSADDPNKPVHFPNVEATTQRQIDLGFAIVGTPDQVVRKLVDLGTVYGTGELDWLCWNFFAQGQSSFDVARKQLDLFATKVLPRIR